MGIKILCSACFTFISKVTRFVISDSGPQFDPQGLGIIVLGFLGVRGLIWEEKKTRYENAQLMWRSVEIFWRGKQVEATVVILNLQDFVIGRLLNGDAIIALLNGYLTT